MNNVRNTGKSLAFIAGMTISGFASAALIPSGDVVINDRGTSSELDDLFYFRDLSHFSDMDYSTQLTAINGLNTTLSGVGNWADDWHLASSSEMSDLFADMITVADVFLPSYASDFVGRYAETPGVGAHYVYEVLVGGSPPVTSEIYEVNDTSDYPLLGAWAVASYGGAPVPEPATIGLILTSLLGMRFFRKKTS